LRIALRVEVNGVRAAGSGLPALLDLLGSYGFKASFLLSLGPDPRQSLPGRWFQSTRIGRQCGEILKEIIRRGHEAGVAAHDIRRWLSRAANADAGWTRRQLQLAVEAYVELFQEAPRLHGASGWQINPHLLSLEGELGFTHACDTRGKTQYLPSLLGQDGDCPPIPTTLPTFAELLQRPGVTRENLHEYLFAETLRILPHGEVMPLQIDDDATDHLETIEKILVMWKGTQGEFLTLGELLQKESQQLPRHEIGWDASIPATRAPATQCLPVEHP